MHQEAFRDDCISRGHYPEGVRRGPEEIADEHRSGRPTTARTDKNVNSVCVPTVDRAIQQKSLTPKTCPHWDSDRGYAKMRKVRAKLVPKVLTEGQ